MCVCVGVLHPLFTPTRYDSFDCIPLRWSFMAHASLLCYTTNVIKATSLKRSIKNEFQLNFKNNRKPSANHKEFC